MVWPSFGPYIYYLLLYHYIFCTIICFSILMIDLVLVTHKKNELRIAKPIKLAQIRIKRLSGRQVKKVQKKILKSKKKSEQMAAS